MLTKDLITKHEGRKNRLYQDSLGNWTIGIGYNLSSEVISDAVIDLLYEEYMAGLMSQMTRTYRWFAELPDDKKAAITDMRFNLGPARFSEFQTFISLIAASKFKEAAQDLRGTLVYKQLPVRYEELAKILET